MNYAETRAELIDPKLGEAGWGVLDGRRQTRQIAVLAHLLIS